MATILSKPMGLNDYHQQIEQLNEDFPGKAQLAHLSQLKHYSVAKYLILLDST
jgi:hypothetical protein